MTTRRRFLTDITKTSALAFLPLRSQLLFAETPLNADTIIDAVEILQVTGPYTSVPGVTNQPQIRQTDIYPELRTVAPYKDRTDSKETTHDLTHIYIRIKTKGGVEGLYGELEPEVVAPIVEQLRPFLIGKDAMAVETVWDLAYSPIAQLHRRIGLSTTPGLLASSCA